MNSRLPFRPSAPAIVVAAFLLGSAASFGGGDSGKIHWKQVEAAQLKLDGKAPLSWNVYQPDKKKLGNLVLVLLGHRYLALDIRSKRVYAVVPSDLQAQGKEFESETPVKPERLIPTSDWTERDVGPAERIELKLGDYGRVLEIELPHMPDMRAFY